MGGEKDATTRSHVFASKQGEDVLEGGNGEGIAGIIVIFETVDDWMREGYDAAKPCLRVGTMR
jgi:hypothetical protein